MSETGVIDIFTMPNGDLRLDFAGEYVAVIRHEMVDSLINSMRESQQIGRVIRESASGVASGFGEA